MKKSTAQNEMAKIEYREKNLCEIDLPDEITISGVIDESVVDGPGIRFVLFVQGCPHNCKGCHNPQTHDFNGGTSIKLKDAVQKITESIDENPLITGVTFSGGEPMCQAAALCPLADEVKKRNLDLMVYSGYTYEQLMEKSESDCAVNYLLSLTDKLVDGPFILEKRDLTLEFRGSSNQRVIDMVKTRKSGTIVEYVSDKWNIPM